MHTEPKQVKLLTKNSEFFKQPVIAVIQDTWF